MLENQNESLKAELVVVKTKRQQEREEYLAKVRMLNDALQMSER
jgi:hypothetical protein